MTIEAFTLQLLYKTMRNGCVGDIEFLSETNDFSYFLDVDQTLIYLKSDVHANLRKILMGISDRQTWFVKTLEQVNTVKIFSKKEKEKNL